MERDYLISKIDEARAYIESRKQPFRTDWQILDLLNDLDDWLNNPMEVVEGKTGYFCPVCDARLHPIDKQYCWFCGQAVERKNNDNNAID